MAKRVVILGGGFAGVYTAIRLERLRDGHADARGHALAEGACGMIPVMLATSEPHLETGDFTQKQPDDSR